jgi:arylsulfatase
MSQIPLVWKRLFLCLTACFVAAARPNAAAAQPLRPNIVLVMADDMGFSDIGCYGSEIQTPRLDALAAGGLRFTQFYNASRCCPTRAALLTGLFNHQAGIGLMTEELGYEAYRGELSRRAMTIPEVLRSAGYRNYMSGKWHVTRHLAPIADKASWPLGRGFDRFYGTTYAAGSYYDPLTLARGDKYITPVNDAEYQPDHFYYTDAITDNAVRYVAEHARDHAAQPFFLYVAYTAPHWPMHVPADDAARYRGRYDGGYAPIRAARYARAVELGVIERNWPLSPDDLDWEQTPYHTWESRSMEVYAAMVSRMDSGIGRIVDELKRRGAWENTLFLYLQDNGASAEGEGRQSNVSQISGVRYRPLGRDELQTHGWPPMQTRDGRPVRTGPLAMPGPDDSYVAYGRGWANVSNTPFRGYKHEALEGGISTPLVVHWPAGIPGERRGQIVRDVGHVIDVMATCVDVSGATYAAEFNGQSILPLEGVSLVPAFAGEPLRRANPLGFEHHGNLALRDGRWKIVSTFRPDESRRWALYDMEADRTEATDLAARFPEKLAEMVAKWQKWADRVGVQPWPIRPRPVRAPD